MSVAGFNPTRLTLARKRRGLGKWDLANKASLSARTIYSYEAGRTVPDEATLKNLASILHFPVEFFDGPDLYVPPIGGTSHY